VLNSLEIINISSEKHGLEDRIGWQLDQLPDQGEKLRKTDGHEVELLKILQAATVRLVQQAVVVEALTDVEIRVG
jgi:hypothetical protein